MTVPVTREEVRLVREPIGPGTGIDATIGEEAADVVLTEERVVVSKETVPVERVRLGTETITSCLPRLALRARDSSRRFWERTNSSVSRRFCPRISTLSALLLLLSFPLSAADTITGGNGTLYLGGRPNRIYLIDEATEKVTGEIECKTGTPSDLSSPRTTSASTCSTSLMRMSRSWISRPKR